MKFYKYTPALLDPKTLEDTLIGRDMELDNLKRILKSASNGKSFSHAIMIGPKGIGKTHVLRILYHAVRGEIKIKGINAFMDKYIPVIFSEEEYPGSITKLLILTLHYLSESKPASIPPIPAELMDAVTLGSKEKELAFSYIRNFRKKTSKILLLIVDNLNDIIERFTDEDQSSLREILMSHDSILLVGAAPTLFDSIINHDRPFYNFFEIIWLKDLSFEESVALLNRYAELEGRNDLIQSFKEKEGKLKAIHELAGGNPRLILSLYHIIVEGDIMSVEDTFLKLLDELSPYFRERMKDLSEQQKEIIDAMARAEGLLTPTELAGRCQMPVNLINSQLKRLEKVGYVQVSKKQAKRVFYDFNERLFSLWRQMRVEAGRKRLGFIVKFLEIWFTKEELFSYLDKILDDVRIKLSSEHAEIQPDIDKLWYLKEAIPEYKSDDEICVACRRKEHEVALEMIEKNLKDRPNDPEMLNKLGCVYIKIEKYNEAVEICEKVISLKPEMFGAWFNLGNAYRHLKRYNEAIVTYRKAAELNPKKSYAWLNIGNTLIALNRYDEAVDAYKKAVEIKPTNYEAWDNLGIAFDNLKRYSEAIEAYRKAIEIKPDHYGAYYNLGLTYASIKRYDDAITAYRKAIELKPDTYDAWTSLGIVHADIKKYDEAINFYRKAIEISPERHGAWCQLGSAYTKLKKYDEARKSLLEAIKLEPDCGFTENNILFVYLNLYVKRGIRGDSAGAIKNLREFLLLSTHITKKDKLNNFFIKALKEIIIKKKIDMARWTLDEIRNANLTELIEFLSPFSTLIKYLETKDREIIDRLKHEERIVVEDMLRILEERPAEKPKNTVHKNI